jgi:hypothetical protein
MRASDIPPRPLIPPGPHPEPETFSSMASAAPMPSSRPMSIPNARDPAPIPLSSANYWRDKVFKDNMDVDVEPFESQSYRRLREAERQLEQAAQRTAL